MIVREETTVELTFTEADGERVLNRFVGVVEGLPVSVRVVNVLAEKTAVSVAATDSVADGLGVVRGLALDDEVALPLVVSEGDPDPVAEAKGLGVVLGDADSTAVTLELGVALELPETDASTETDAT